VGLRLGIAAVAVSAALAVSLALAYDLTLEQVVVLAPAIVIGAAAVLGLTLLWSRVAWESLRQARHPWRIVALGAGGLALLVGLTFLGVKLPHE
jgi:hypothetical protein